MALDGSRSKREFDKFVADGTGNTGLRVITSSNETIESSSGTVNISGNFKETISGSATIQFLNNCN